VCEKAVATFKDSRINATLPQIKEMMSTGYPGNLRQPEHSSAQHPVALPESDALRSVLTPSVFIRQQAGWQPAPGLWYAENVDLKSWVYTNQSEPGEARVAGSNSGGGINRLSV